LAIGLNVACGEDVAIVGVKAGITAEAARDIGRLSTARIEGANVGHDDQRRPELFDRRGRSRVADRCEQR
jgi:hypothetical protein